MTDMTKGLHTLDSFLDLILPRGCLICGRRLTASEKVVCTVCLLHLPRTEYHHTPLDNPVAELFWGLANVYRASAYIFYVPHSDVSKIIFNMKYYGNTDACYYMGMLMAGKLAGDGFFTGVDILLPVPLSRGRRRTRGYNQSEVMARGISAVTGIPVETKAIERRAFTTSQTRLTRMERMNNVNNLFVLKDDKRLTGKHVMLIDDVITSGATMIACARAIGNVPDIKISVLSLAFSKNAVAAQPAGIAKKKT